MNTSDNVKSGIPKRIVLFVGICLVILIASLLKKDVEYSSFENRTMEFFHWPDVNSVMSGEWFESFETYNLDQVIGRDLFVEINTHILRALGKRQIDRITACDDDTLLIISYDFPQPARVGDTFTENVLIPLKDAAKSYGGQFYYMNIYPRDVYFWDSFPYHKDETVKDYHAAKDEDMNTLLERGILPVDTYGITEEHSDEYLFFYSDHHYTYKGAYYSYKKLLDVINANNPDREPLDFPEWDQMDHFRPEGRFWGSLVSHLGDPGYENRDFLEYALPKDYPPEYTRLEFGEPSDMPLIRQDETTEYGFFMNGDYGNTVIKTNRPERPSILIIGKSCTDALEVMAVYDFNEMHSIDPRMFENNITAYTEYIKNAKCDYVVVQDIFEME